MSNGFKKLLQKNTQIAKNLGYQANQFSPQLVAQMVKIMEDMYKDPNSFVSKYTAQCRANGIPCLKDDLDSGKLTIEESLRASIFVKQS